MFLWMPVVNYKPLVPYKLFHKILVPVYWAIWLVATYSMLRLGLTDCCNIQRTAMTCLYINSGQSKFEFEYLGESETVFKNILGYEKAAPVGTFDEETRGKKISCYCPFDLWLISLNIMGVIYFSVFSVYSMLVSFSTDYTVAKTIGNRSDRRKITLFMFRITRAGIFPRSS